jgi:hypothetical protein
MIVMKGLNFCIHGSNLARMLNSGLDAFGLAHGEKRMKQVGVRNCAHMGAVRRFENA